MYIIGGFFISRDKQRKEVRSLSSKRRIKIRRGKFYIYYPNGSHPSLIFSKNKRKNRYDAIVFGTTPGRHRIKLDHPMSPNVEMSVVQTRPVRGVRSDFGDKEVIGLYINKDDKIKIEIIKRRKPKKSAKYKKQQNSKI